MLPYECRGDADDLPKLGGYLNSEIESLQGRVPQRLSRRGAAAGLCRDDPRPAHAVAFGVPVGSDAAEAVSGLPVPLRRRRRSGRRGRRIEEWAEDPEDDALNVLLAGGVDDVPWPVAPEPEELAARRAVAALVEAARARGDATSAPDALPAGGERAAIWQRDADLLLDEIRRRRSRVVEVAGADAADHQPGGGDGAGPGPLRRVDRSPDAVTPGRAGATRLAVPPVGRAALRLSPLIEPDDLVGARDDDLDDAELAELQQKFLVSGWGEKTTGRGRGAVRDWCRRAAAPWPDRCRLRRRDDGGYDVIDYKTGAVLTGKDFEAASYQLSIYRLAWADLAGVDPSAVTAGFLYVREALLKRPERLLDRDELAALLDR